IFLQIGNKRLHPHIARAAGIAADNHREGLALVERNLAERRTGKRDQRERCREASQKYFPFHRSTPLPIAPSREIGRILLCLFLDAAIPRLALPLSEGHARPGAAPPDYEGGFPGAPWSDFCMASISAPKVRQSPLLSASNARR